MNFLVKTIVVLGLIISSTIPGFAAADKLSADSEKKEEVVLNKSMGTITGTISAVSSDSISVAYHEDKAKGIEYEMLLPLDKTFNIENKKGLNELKIGDTVKITYEDVASENVNSKEQKIERKAKIVSFIRSAVKKPEGPKIPEPGDEFGE